MYQIDEDDEVLKAGKNSSKASAGAALVLMLILFETVKLLIKLSIAYPKTMAAIGLFITLTALSYHATPFFQRISNESKRSAYAENPYREKAKTLKYVSDLEEWTDDINVKPVIDKDLVLNTKKEKINLENLNLKK